MQKSWWETYGGRAGGLAAGLFFGIVYLISGFWDMMFVALLIGAGYWIGKLKDEKKGPLINWERLTDWVAERWPWSR